MAPENLSPFQQAFAEARREGSKTFSFDGRLFTTQTKEELEAQQSTEPQRLSMASPTPGGAQQSMQDSPAGQAMGSAAGKVPGLLEGIKNNAASILSGRETDIAGGIPQFRDVQQSFQQADQQSKQSGANLVDRDIARHKTGSRESTLDNGFWATLLGSQGHEANTLALTGAQLLKGKPFDRVSMTGQDLTAGRFVAESVQDSVNNLFGQAEALLIQLGVGSRETPPDLGEIAVDKPGTKSHAVGSVIESGVNKLADLVSHFQTVLAQAKENPDVNSESQVAANSGAGQAREG